MHHQVSALLVISAKRQLSNRHQSLLMSSAEDGGNALEVLIAPLEQLIPSSVLLEHSQQLSNLGLQHSALLAQLATIVKLQASLL